MEFSIIVSVLAIVAVIVVALVLWAGVNEALLRSAKSWGAYFSAIEERSHSASTSLEQRVSALEQATPPSATLAAEVADLHGAVERLALSTRKQFGTVFGKLGNEQSSLAETREETLARLRHEHRLPLIGSKE